MSQGTIWRIASESDLREGLEEAFSYRGDVTLRLRDGRTVEGYIFDRNSEKAQVRLLPKDSREKVSIGYAEIAGLEFTGRDTAAGKSWEAWVKKYLEKKAAGEKDIGLEPEMIE